MNSIRFREITRQYPRLRVAVVGDFCLDRYLEIDPARAETSIETGLAVHNVVNVRAQPGGAGTIVNNLASLGLGRIFPVGFCGCDGEGFELGNALRQLPTVSLDYFLQTSDRRTFTYCKPLLLEPGKPPVELNRLDTKNWTPTPDRLSQRLAAAVNDVANTVDALIVLDQVDLPETGVVTRALKQVLAESATRKPTLPVIADSRQGLKDFPPLIYKMNAAEFGALLGRSEKLERGEIPERLAEFARAHGQSAFVTAAEGGIYGATAEGRVHHFPALPVRGPIDIVGAGDAVTANLASALAAGASLPEALELATAAASIVIHKLGTTGTASVAELAPLLTPPAHG